MGTSALGYCILRKPTASAIEKAKKTKKQKNKISKVYPEDEKPRVKSPEAKQAVVDADMETMSAMALSMIMLIKVW